MIKSCNHCGKKYEAKRDTAKYCSDKCRVNASRVSVTKVSVTDDKTLSVTPNMDDIYSPNYDLTEAGFIRRNKNWADFSEEFRERRRVDAKRINIIRLAEIAESQALRSSVLASLAPKSKA